jgi:hypothetical protein
MSRTMTARHRLRFLVWPTSGCGHVYGSRRGEYLKTSLSRGSLSPSTACSPRSPCTIPLRIDAVASDDLPIFRTEDTSVSCPADGSLREMARSSAQLFLSARGARLTSRPAGQHRQSDPFGSRPPGLCDARRGTATDNVVGCRPEGADHDVTQVHHTAVRRWAMRIPRLVCEASNLRIARSCRPTPHNANSEDFRRSTLWLFHSPYRHRSPAPRSSWS